MKLNARFFVFCLLVSGTAYAMLIELPRPASLLKPRLKSALSARTMRPAAPAQAELRGLEAEIRGWLAVQRSS